MSSQPEQTSDHAGEPGAQPLSPEETAALMHYGLLEKNLRNGANWFFWIAALSVVNSVILLLEGDRSFVIGLGVTQVINVAALTFAQQAPKTAAICTTRSRIVGMPNGRCLPSALGIHFRRTACG